MELELHEIFTIYLKRSGMTQKELAEKIGTKQTAISLALSRRGAIGENLGKRIGDALGLDVEFIVNVREIND